MTSPTQPLRVASVPAAHPYVVNLELERCGVRVLDELTPAGAPPGRWWPPVRLDAGWIASHAAEFDVMHLHFGAESLSVAALGAVCHALERAGLPLVCTVHDLQHPQLVSQAHHLAQLDVLLPRAAELITLTPGAATELHQRWGQTATVIPHPRMLTGALPRPDDSADALRIGVHLRDLRPNIDGPAITAELASAAEALSAAGQRIRVEVHMFEQVRDPGAAERVQAMTEGSAHLELHVSARPGDDALADELVRLDASVLPYRWGTHSGWAELCWDLALPMVGVPVGHLADQHDDLGWLIPSEAGSVRSLTAGLTELAGRHAAAGPAFHEERRRTMIARRRLRDVQAPEIARAHREVYDRARRRIRG